MENLLKEINSFISSQKDEIISFWEYLVNIESFTKDPEGVENVANFLKKVFEKEGMKCEIVPTTPNGPTLTGIIGENRNKKPIVFSGHMDTVFKTGTIKERPFKIVDGKAYGPGVLDMKGGIVIALYTIKALNHIGYDNRPIKIAFCGDEEQGHFMSNAGDVLSEYVKDALCCFNMETGLIDNSICIGRKGRIGCDLEIRGASSHAGNDFASGVNAVEEAAFKILEFRKLTDIENGTTCATTVVNGGKIINSIPNKCKLSLDLRFEKVSEVYKIKEQIKNIASKSYIQGTTTSLILNGEMMPYETTDDVLKLYNFVKAISSKFGFKDIGSKVLGGSSDASYITIAGVPTLCSCGVLGEWNHTENEYAIVDTLFDRINLWSAVILNIDEEVFK